MNDLVNGLFNFFIAIFTIITAPLQLLIDNYFPDLNDFATHVGQLFSSFDSAWIPWLKDLTLLPQWCLNLVIAYYFFKAIASFVGNVYTMVLKYWGTLMP